MISFTHYSEKLDSILKKTIYTDIWGNGLDSDAAFRNIISALQARKKMGDKVMIIGNGGSAAIASHFQNDLCKSVQIRGMVFTEPPLLTALSNDISYIAAYRELVSLWGDKNDMLFAISSSGRSQNILDAVSAARTKGCSTVVTFSGFAMDNPLRSMGDINCYVPSMEYGYVELAHSILTHYISDQASHTE